MNQAAKIWLEASIWKTFRIHLVSPRPSGTTGPNCIKRTIILQFRPLGGPWKHQFGQQCINFIPKDTFCNLWTPEGSRCHGGLQTATGGRLGYRHEEDGLTTQAPSPGSHLYNRYILLEKHTRTHTHRHTYTSYLCLISLTNQSTLKPFREKERDTTHTHTHTHTHKDTNTLKYCLSLISLTG